MARTPGATARPRTMSAAMRRSSIRLLVQEPMKTTSTLAEAMGCPASRPMYSRARTTAARLSGLGKASGEGATPVTGITSSGLVPQVTRGAMAEASIRTSRSKTASGSENRAFQLARAMSQAPPLGAAGRPRK